MIQPRYIELMHGEIDGANSPDQTRDLQAYLAAHPDVQAQFQELREALGLLDGLPAQEPPADLRPRILAAVAAAGVPESAAGRSRLAGWREAWRRLGARAGYRYAFVAGFAACLLVTVVAWHLAAPGRLGDPSHLHGTILRQAAPERAGGEVVSIVGDDLAGRVQVAFDGARTVVRLELTSGRPVEVVFVGEGNLALGGFRATAGAPTMLAADGRRLAFAHDGAGGYEIAFDHHPDRMASLTVRVVAQHDVLWERMIKRDSSR